MSDKQLEEYLKVVEPKFYSHLEKGSIEMNNEILDFFKDESGYFKEACDVIIGADERIVVKEDMNDLLDYITNLQQENEELKLQLKGTTHCYDETELKKFNDKIKKIIEYCRTTQMTFEEFIELERIVNK